VAVYKPGDVVGSFERETYRLVVEYIENEPLSFLGVQNRGGVDHAIEGFAIDLRPYELMEVAQQLTARGVARRRTTDKPPG
jgi:hypothetical protein